MKYLVIDPVSNSLIDCFLSLYDDEFHFLYQYVTDLSNKKIDDLAKSKYIFVCFDIFKTMNMFEFKFDKIYDIETLYRLAGKEFSGLIDLGKKVLGEERLIKYENLSYKMKAHLHSYAISKIDTKRHEPRRLIPKRIFEDLYMERANIIAELFNKFDEKDVFSFYDKFMYKSVKSLHSISLEPIEIEQTELSNLPFRYAKSIRKNMKCGQIYLKFKAVGAKTGRLSFAKNSFNVYSLPKHLRKCIVPRRNCSIVHFDFTSFQPRLAIFSTKNEEFKHKFKDVKDIYSQFPGDREENKTEFFHWLFSETYLGRFEDLASPIRELRDSLYEQACCTGKIVNSFGRVLYFDRNKKKNIKLQNYITSLEADVILGLTRLINRALNNKRSRIMFPFYDSIVLEVHNSETYIIPLIKSFMETFYSNKFGTKFPVKVEKGANFGEMNAVCD